MFSQQKEDKRISQSNIISESEKDKVYQELLIPNKNDTLQWDIIKGNFSNAKADWDYVNESFSMVRGLADTFRLGNRYFSKFDFLDETLRINLCLSPLVVKGKIISKYYEDTVNDRENLMYLTNYVIQIEDIFKSDYKGLKVGDKVLAKVNLYGKIKSKLYNKVLVIDAPAFREYEEGKSYFLCLDKYKYMMIMYSRRNLKDVNAKEIYCPYAFSITSSSHGLSLDYIRNKFNDSSIKVFLSGK